MLRLTVGTLLLLAIGLNGYYLELSELIQRMNEDTVAGSATIVFVDVEDNFLGYFIMNTGMSIPVVIFRKPTLSDSEKKFDWNVILVAHAARTSDEVMHRVIKLVRVRKFVVVCAKDFESLKQSVQFFTENKFTRVFGIIKERTYAYLPYTDRAMVEFSRNEPLPNSLKDLNGFSFRTTISPDLPRVFWFKSRKGERIIGGYVGKIFVNFLKRHNATFIEVDNKNLSNRFMMAVVEATMNNVIDISMNAYKPVNGLSLSYPILLMDWSIIAPIQGYLDPNEYFMRPFSSTVWLCIGVTIIYIVVVNVVMNLFCEQSADLWQCFSRSYLILIGWTTERPITRAYRFYCQLLILSFVLGNFYVVHLTSFLTAYIKVKQFDGIQDLVTNEFPVMMIDYEWKVIEDPKLHPVGFEKIVTLVESTVMFRERNSMVNTSFAYAMGADKALFYLGFQKRFSKSMFHMIRDTLGDYYIGFLLAEHSPFAEILNDFIIDIFQTGLLKKWLNDAIAHARVNRLVVMGTVQPDQKVPYPLTLRHLKFAWTCLGSGLIFGVVIFCIEKIVAPTRVCLNRLKGKYV